jgi:hypothetical protein
MANKSLLGVIAAGGFVLAANAANATVATYTTASQYNAFGGGGTIGDSDPVNWGTFSTAQGNSSVNDSSVPQGASMTTSLNEDVTVTNGGSSPFMVFTNGATGGLPSTRWDGDFANGANVLYASSTTITLNFNGGITGFGVDAQTALAGAFGVSVSAYNASDELLITATNSGISTGRASDSFNTAPFAGVVSTAGDISEIIITVTGPGTAAGFAIDTAQIYEVPDTGGDTEQLPEPGTLALLAGGLAGLAATRRRRNRP